VGRGEEGRGLPEVQGKLVVLQVPCVGLLVCVKKQFFPSDNWSCHPSIDCGGLVHQASLAACHIHMILSNVNDTTVTEWKLGYPYANMDSSCTSGTFAHITAVPINDVWIINLKRRSARIAGSVNTRYPYRHVVTTSISFMWFPRDA